MPRATSTLLAALLLSASAAALVATPQATAAHSYYNATIRSFDGTDLAVTIFTPESATSANKVPYVLMTHGWAGQRTSTPTGRVADLLDAGYGVLTWDSRGFGASGGEVQLNSPDYEVRDVSALITYLSSNVPLVKKVNGDPVIGMSGGSYAGGIQLLAAAFDERIDVIAPEITWNDLAQALGPNGVPKLYWTSLLLGAGAEASCLNARNGNPAGALTAGLTPISQTSTGCQTSDLARFYAEVQATNSIPDDVRAELVARSPATYMSEIDIPTLLVQGFPDTLFDVNQAVANYNGIKANGAPVKLWLYDGGHSHPEAAALVPNTQGALISPTVIKWFDRHLKGDVNVDTGAEVEYYAGGAWHSATAWPDPAATPNALHFAGTPTLMQGPVSGGQPGSYTVPISAGPKTLAGPARISFKATGNGEEGILFLSLGVQNGTTVTTVSSQTQPVRFALEPLTGESTPVATELVYGQARVNPGESLVLTFSATNRDYNGNRVPGIVNVEDVDVAFTTI